MEKSIISTEREHGGSPVKKMRESQRKEERKWWGSSPDTNLHPHTGPGCITALIHQDEDLSCIYTWFNTALKLEWNICLHCYPCFFFTADKGTSDPLVPTHSVYAPPAAATVLLSWKIKRGSLKSLRLWCSWSGFFFFAGEAAPEDGEFVDTVVTGRLGLSAPGFRRKHIRQQRAHTHRHVCYRVCSACSTCVLLNADRLFPTHDRLIHIFIFAFQGHICVVFIYLTADLHLRLGYYWVILSNPIQCSAHVLNPNPPWDLYWIFASTEVCVLEIIWRDSKWACFILQVTWKEQEVTDITSFLIA